MFNGNTAVFGGGVAMSGRSLVSWKWPFQDVCIFWCEQCQGLNSTSCFPSFPPPFLRSTPSFHLPHPPPFHAPSSPTLLLFRLPSLLPHLPTLLLPPQSLFSPLTSLLLFSSQPPPLPLPPAHPQLLLYDGALVQFVNNFVTELGAGMYVEYTSSDFVLAVLNRGCFIQYFNASIIDTPPSNWVSTCIDRCINR